MIYNELSKDEERLVSLIFSDNVNQTPLNYEPSKIKPIGERVELSEYSSRIQELNDMGIVENTYCSIKNVRRVPENPYKLIVPLSSTFHKGKTDAIIRFGNAPNYLNLIALIEFKTFATVHDGTDQGLFEYIGILFKYYLKCTVEILTLYHQSLQIYRIK